MQDNIVPLNRNASSKPISYTQITADGKDLCSYCLILLQQLDLVGTGTAIQITRRYCVAAIQAAQKELAEMHGYPTTFQEGGAHGFGTLIFR
jgi:hypothetical protein